MSDFSAETLQELGLSPLNQTVTAAKSNNELGQSDFLKLMTVQLANQDPLEPMENTDFIAQMAQFSTLTGIESLTESFGTLSQSLSQGQTLQAATLVGRDALVPATSGELSEGSTISGAVDLETSASSVTVEVVDAYGATVSRFPLDNTGSGLQFFTWDGLCDDGALAEPGVYQFRATATGEEGAEAAQTLLVKRIDSVAVDANGALELSVQGGDSVAFADVRQIR